MGGEARGAGASSPAGAPPHRRAHQVPDAEQDGAGADMAAQAAAVGVEPRPGRDHLHRSGRGRRGASARPSLQERRSRRSGLLARLLPALPPLPLPLPAPLTRSPARQWPRLRASAESSERLLRPDPALRRRQEEEEERGGGRRGRAT